MHVFIVRSKKLSYYPGRIEDYVPVSEYTLVTLALSDADVTVSLSLSLSLSVCVYHSLGMVDGMHSPFDVQKDVMHSGRRRGCAGAERRQVYGRAIHVHVRRHHIYKQHLSRT